MTFGLSYFKSIFLLHIFVITFIFLYVGFSRQNTPIWFYWLLLIIGIIIIFYHSYRLVTHGLKDSFWNYFHIFVLGPLLILTFFWKKNTPRVVYDIYIGLGAACLLLNLYFLMTH